MSGHDRYAGVRNKVTPVGLRLTHVLTISMSCTAKTGQAGQVSKSSDNLTARLRKL